MTNAKDKGSKFPCQGIWPWIMKNSGLYFLYEINHKFICVKMDKNVCIQVSELLQLRNGALQCLELTFRPTLLEAKMKLAAWARYISSWNKVEAYYSRLSELYWAWYLFLRSSTLTMLSIALLVQIHFVHKLLIYKRCNSKSYHKKRLPLHPTSWAPAIN